MAAQNPELYVGIVSRTKHLRVPRKKIFALVEHIASEEKGEIHDVSIAIVDSREMARINRDYLQHAGPTDVISFDLTDHENEVAPKSKYPGISAEIVVCGQVARQESQRRAGGVQRELLLYITHGLLHMLGYDDQTPEAHAAMHARQEELLGAFLAKQRIARKRAPAR